MNKMPNEFILICNKYGEPAHVMSIDSSYESIFSILRLEDYRAVEYSPHSAWKWDGKQFLQLKDHNPQ